MAPTILSNEQDRFVWKWTKSGKFSVKSSKIPLKIKIWLWMIWQNAIATKDNLLKRNWQWRATC
jgi:hypothetical protein